MVSSSKFFSYSYILLATANNIPTCRFLLRMESVEGCVSKYIMNRKRTHLVPIAILKLTDSNLSFSLFVAHEILGLYRCISSHFEPILGSCWIIIAPVLFCSKPLNFSYETSQNVMETQAFEALGKSTQTRPKALFGRLLLFSLRVHHLVQRKHHPLNKNPSESLDRWKQSRDKPKPKLKFDNLTNGPVAYSNFEFLYNSIPKSSVECCFENY
jgi:hypothetical protein